MMTQAQSSSESKTDFEAETSSLREEEIYQSPLKKRYASPAMLKLFSEQTRASTWRFIWTTLAKSQQSLGLHISDEQIQELEENQNSIDFQEVQSLEKELRHDVMAHIHAYAKQCPQAASILHLGATSCLVTDNADLYIFKKGLELLKERIELVCKELACLAQKYKDLPCLSFTHYQVAQPCTVGKRFCLWLQDFVEDYKDLKKTIQELKLLGIKGATGTQASFLDLFQGESHKVKDLEKAFVKALGFSSAFSLSGQTYSRKQDCKILDQMAAIAISAQKMATDLRLLSHDREVEEAFAKKQVGSSAMPHKKNPMKAERICSLSRFVLSLQSNASQTASTQWLERSLDDSANRRLSIPQAFLTVDAILLLCTELLSKLQVNEKMIRKNLEEELPFLLSEKILMLATKLGGNRQDIHEALRVYNRKWQEEFKAGKTPFDFFHALAQDPLFPFSKQELQDLCQADKITGLSSMQTKNYLEEIKSLDFIKVSQDSSHEDRNYTWC